MGKIIWTCFFFQLVENLEQTLALKTVKLIG